MTVIGKDDGGECVGVVLCERCECLGCKSKAFVDMAVDEDGCRTLVWWPANFAVDAGYAEELFADLLIAEAEFSGASCDEGASADNGRIKPQSKIKAERISPEVNRWSVDGVDVCKVAGLEKEDSSWECGGRGGSSNVEGDLNVLGAW